MKRNWIVILVVAVALSAMLYSTLRKARSGGSGGAALSAADPKGKTAPDFELKDLSGQSVRLADLKGKAVLLNFWATWCGPCKVETPWFVDLQKQYGAQGLQVVGIAMDDAGHDAIAKFAALEHINYPVLIGTERVGEAYGGVESLPTTFYIGRDGRIVKRILGLTSHADAEEAVRAALARANTGLAGDPVPPAAPATSTPAHTIPASAPAGGAH